LLHREEDAMNYVDRLFRFLSVTALWLVAAMIYVAFFHEGGQWKPVAQTSAPPPVTFPAKFAVTNADGAPLRIVGEVTMAQPAKPAPAPKVRFTCKFSGTMTTAQPSLRLFSDAWKPDREWPLDAKLECETVEPVQ
jgi:hypothetical protein